MVTASDYGKSISRGSSVQIPSGPRIFPSSHLYFSQSEVSNFFIYLIIIIIIIIIIITIIIIIIMPILGRSMTFHLYVRVEKTSQ